MVGTNPIDPVNVFLISSNSTSDLTISTIVFQEFFFFSKITKLLWGKNTEIPSYHISRWLFLKLLGIIYFIAFTSFWVQWEGVVGENGILPVTEFFKQIEEIRFDYY